MPTAKLLFDQDIAVSPETAFAYVADLTRHGEWSANDLVVTAETPDGVAVGSVYHSIAEVGRLQFVADLTITKLEPPTLFGFSGVDRTGQFEHTFIFRPIPTGVNVSRLVTFDLSFKQWLFFLLLYLPVRRPAAKKGLARLKTTLERSAT